MTVEKLNSYLGEYVKITFKDGEITEGLLSFTPEFSAKYGYRRPNFYTCNLWDFKLSHVIKIEPMVEMEDTE